MSTVVLSVRVDREVADQLKATAGNVSAYVAAVLTDAVQRGVMVTTSGAVLQPPQGDMFNKPAAKAAKRRTKR